MYSSTSIKFYALIICAQTGPGSGPQLHVQSPVVVQDDTINSTSLTILTPVLIKQN